MVTEPASQQRRPLRHAGVTPEQLLLKRLTVAFGLLATAIGLLGIICARLGITLIGGAIPNNKTIPLSAALIWIFLGAVLAYQGLKPLDRIAGLFIRVVLVLIAISEAVEFILSVQGGHFFIETLFVNAGASIIGPASSPISPAAAGLAVFAAISLAIVIGLSGTSAGSARIRDAVSILGLVISLLSITFVLGYAYGSPLFYGTQYIPIAALSALAAFFVGAALISAAGPGAVPVRYLIGTSTSARLLRVFVPLAIGIVLLENFAFVGLSSWFSVHDAVLVSGILVVFVLATAFVVARVSGGIGRALDEAEQELVRKNEDLGAANEELTATQEELRQTNDELVANERQLMQKNDDLNVLNEELTATQEELRQNIEELTRAEKTLRESEDRFRSIAEISPVQLSIARRSDGGILYSNPEYDRAFGFGPGEFAGHKTPDLYFDPADREKVLGIFKDKGSVENYEVLVKKKDGTPFWINVSLRAIRFSGNDAVLAAGIDLSERKQAEQALAESQQENTFLADLLNHSEQPFGVGFPDGRLGIVNGAFERLTGYSGDELRGMDWATVLTPPEWQEAEKKNLEELHRTGVPVRYEKEYLRKDGSRVPIELLVHLVKDAAGNPLHYYSFITDITERKQAKEQLEKKNDDLNALNEELTSTEEELRQNIDELGQREQALSKALLEKDVLLSEIHHRVKNNLTAFISLLSLEGSTEDSQSGKILKQDLQNRARSMALIHETLYRTNMYDEVDMEVYLTTLLDQIANSFKTTKPVKIAVDAHGVMLDIPRATPAGLIINELVTNSFKYAFPDSSGGDTARADPPTIMVALAKNDGSYTLTVKDNGTGLPADFDPASTKTLGLKLVNFLAKHQMRAKVEVKSKSGTEFTFHFRESLK